MLRPAEDPGATNALNINAPVFAGIFHGLRAVLDDPFDRALQQQ